MEFATDRKLADFRLYYNGYSAHGGLAGQPLDSAEDHGGIARTSSRIDGGHIAVDSI